MTNSEKRRAHDSRRSRSILTERQIEILMMRKEGCTQKEIADRLDISRQDVSILERRALRNLSAAADAISAAARAGVACTFKLSSGTHILDAAKKVIEEADRMQIRLKSSAIGVTSMIRAAASNAIAGGVLQKEIAVTILPDGRVTMYQSEKANLNDSPEG
ncbi:MAG: Tfx family DNA-binding protein [Thermoplasmata archaeon YP2-bin.285]|uniref:Tfx family DNA-binding protein n=1 Tax=Candidatus Sysuiplasma superficiale TaxID=2823368 RepID=A0A8J8CEU6_9ARCH|nr:Tfx family DNA-binding protein [Candidatus Sysuiplasma superficiale]